VTDGSTHLGWCLANPPAPGTTHHADERCIEIAGAIRVGEDCGAQVVLTVDGLIAKIYDRLYYKAMAKRRSEKSALYFWNTCLEKWILDVDPSTLDEHEREIS
jgi:hypothetical protein